MLNSEKNMTNLKDAETLVSIGDSRKTTGTKCGNWDVNKKHDGKI